MRDIVLAAPLRARAMSAPSKTTRRPDVIFVRRRRWWDRRSQDHARRIRKPGLSDERNPGSSVRSVRGRSRVSLRSTQATKKKRKAERRKACSVTAVPHGTARAPSGARSPLGVPPRHLRQRPNATAQLEPRDFPGLVRSARPDGSKDGAHRNACYAKPAAGLPCVTRGRYPRLAVPVQRDCTRRPVMMPVRACLAQAAREPR